MLNKILSLLISILIFSKSFCQYKAEFRNSKVEFLIYQDENSKTIRVKLLNNLENINVNKEDSNAFKLYYIRYVFPAKNNTNIADTIWAPVIAVDTNEIKSWQNVYRTSDNDLWYTSKEPVTINDKEITIWTRDWRFYITKSSKDDPKLQYKLILCTFNYQDKTYKRLREIQYDFKNNIIKDIKFNEEFQYPLPKSLGEIGRAHV